jgi:hypothetical protein
LIVVAMLAGITVLGSLSFKHDNWRCVAYIDHGYVKLVSRRGTPISGTQL